MRIIKMLNLKKAAAYATIFIIFFAACQPDNEILSSLDIQNVNSETASSALESENSELATAVMGALTRTQYAGARFAADTLKNLSDSRLTCASVVLNRTGTVDMPAGTITIDFGNGLKSTGVACTDNHGIQRKGQIVITYSGKRWVAGSYHIIELIKFYRNSALIEGTEYDTTLTVSDTLQLSMKSRLNGGKVTFGDGKTIYRDHTLTKTWYRFLDSFTGRIDPTKDEWHIAGSANGTNKNGDSYVMATSTDLIHKLSCWINNKVYIPVQGTKTITVDNINYEIDYGTGTYDNQVVVTVNGKSKVITVTGDGN